MLLALTIGVAALCLVLGVSIFDGSDYGLSFVINNTVVEGSIEII